ncbi:membrane-bound lytic murein transglycosylase C [endosymbiont of Sipalinus gigas]|uniref:murein transglycosylase domain-containing protein n=1 Tax=endosymbiont of Sipalinus gigas TaxID=1972134 RepID=UPI000DC71473|nr:murein transglycosylase domain-containing protein [endosymbiont of Sipalinus gigas]BBA85221.1 membrane-bound lytic murein transglycosylase C [endosymbiont of Sipalinus gigas]
MSFNIIILLLIFFININISLCKDIYSVNKKYWNNYKINNINYSESLKIRSYIDFNLKILIVETLHNDNPKFFLEKEIVKILLKNNLFFIDIVNKNISNYEILAKYIVNRYFNIKKTYNNKYMYFVSLNFLDLYYKDLYNNYNKLIDINSSKYNIDKKLVLSIIKAESNFNSFAVSKSGAIGLMQILYNKSAKDVFNIYKNLIRFKKEELFNPEHNIEIGIAYISIIQNKYFSKIENSESLRYITIASYNGGINSIINIFLGDSNNFVYTINNMSSNLVYKSIVKHHPIKEIREYLKKVNKYYNEN